jgi:hypothetical protein
MEKTDFRNIVDICLLELADMFREIEKDEKSITDFFINPRTFLSRKGILVPTGFKISFTPTEEFQARLFSENGVKNYVTQEQSSEGQIEIHVENGIAKCVTIKFECPKKKKKKSEKTIDANRIKRLGDISIKELSDIVYEVENDDKIADELLMNPRAFFEKRNYIGGKNTFIELIDTNKLEDLLKGEKEIIAFLDDRAFASQTVHIKSGKGKCTKVKIKCPGEK